MINTFDINIITGGYFVCTPDWNRPFSLLDQCFKLYVPVSGEVFLQKDEKDFLIKENNVYFISGYNLSAQFCKTKCHVYWVHFIPKSLFLRHLLIRNFSVERVSSAFYQPLKCLFESNIHFFNGMRLSDKKHHLNIRLQHIEMKFNAFLLTILSELLEKVNLEEFFQHSHYKQLSKLIHYMNDHYIENPSLEVLGNVANMSKIHLHRQFTDAFHVTPYNYMLKKRMEDAMHLLASSNLSINEIAYKVGYRDIGYFSRLFKKQMGISPNQYRKNNMNQTP